jgi:hypothetical protein
VLGTRLLPRAARAAVLWPHAPDERTRRPTKTMGALADSSKGRKKEEHTYQMVGGEGPPHGDGPGEEVVQRRWIGGAGRGRGEARLCDEGGRCLSAVGGRYPKITWKRRMHRESSEASKCEPIAEQSGERR